MLAFALISAILSFISTILLLHKFIPFFHNIGLTGKDMNKLGNIEVADAGGFAVIIGLLMGAYSSFLITYLLFSSFPTGYINAAFLSMLMLSVLGFLEDLTNLLKNKQGKKIGFKQKYKLLLPLPAALPIMLTVLNRSTIVLPFIGAIDLGLLYPLILVPIGIIGASNATNLLGGLNGLEGGLALVMFSAISAFSFIKGLDLVFFIALSFIGAVLGFMVYNKYPAKIFPGDSFTYLFGGSVAILSILGDFERLAVALMLPWFVEFFLKYRSRFKAESFGKITKEGVLIRPYKKVFSLTHVFMRGISEDKIVARMILAYALYAFLIVWLFLY